MIDMYLYDDEEQSQVRFVGFVGDCFALGGSWLDNEVGLESSLCESRLDGR